LLKVLAVDQNLFAAPACAGKCTADGVAPTGTTLTLQAAPNHSIVYVFFTKGGGLGRREEPRRQGLLRDGR
jgi:hypothetical protein